MICIFDVNETLLDLAAMDADFESIFGKSGVRIEWFNQFLQSALVSVITDTYRPFGTFGSAAFDMVAAKHGISVRAEDKTALLGKIVHLPAHEDVVPGLKMLRDADFKTATLTNSTAEVAKKQLAFAGIDEYFDRILSADSINCLKPARSVYEMAANEFGVDVSEIILIAAHSWDIAGAKAAGLKGAFVTRGGNVPDPTFVQPDFVGSSIGEIADSIIIASNI